MLQPYLSLSCLEAINFLNKKRTRINIKNYSSHSVENIRNSLKNSMNRINKIYKNLEEDELEIDSQFSHEVKNQFLQKNNLYYNIGLYSDENKRFISDTQYIWSIIKQKKDDDTYLTEDELNKSMYFLGVYQGECTKNIAGLLNRFKLNETSKAITSVVELFYKDTHTDRMRKVEGLDKTQTLFLLHTLSSINGVRNLLCTILPRENTYLFRIKYIVTYYAFCRLKKFANKIQIDKVELTPEMKELIVFINQVKQVQGDYFEMRFRSCMMHYNLKKDGICAIDRNLINQDIPFYGLVESCFNGKSFNEQNTIITNLSNDFSDLLERIIPLEIENSCVL